MEQNKRIIPFFKTHYSIGKSILTMESKVKENGPSSVIEIAKEYGIKKVVLVEDQMHGFLKTKREMEKNDLDFIFGLRLPVVDSYEQKEFHKVIVFAKNDDGIRKLYKIYSKANCEHEGRLTLSDLFEYWEDDHLTLHIPFYDSYIHKNNFSFDCFVPDFSNFGDISFCLEDNGLPIDIFLKNKVIEIAKNMKAAILDVKSIFYKNKEDFKAYQTFRIINLRKGGRITNISRPELEGCGSDQFCIESWAEKCEI